MNKKVNGQLTGYYLDGDQILIEKQNGVNTAQYEWGNGLIRCNGEYPLTDGRGNVRQSTNASQSITSANAPTAFGIGSVTGGTASAYSYGASSGYRQDGVAPAGLPSSYALQKVGARYYDPAVGGFLTRDTDLSQSPYAYCGGDPVNRSDPSGHSWFSSFFNAVVNVVKTVVSTVVNTAVNTVKQAIVTIAQQGLADGIFLALLPYFVTAAVALFGPTLAAVAAVGFGGGAITGLAVAAIDGQNPLEAAFSSSLYFGFAVASGQVPPTRKLPPQFPFPGIPRY